MKSKKTYPNELIGVNVEIVNSNQVLLIGVNGKIIDESKDTLKLINKEGKIKTLLKSSITFKILKNNKIIEGNSIKKRPEERLKG
ncbi:hypothetical protein HN385_06675 [archaeon]|jgi:ribonuclease P protein subunit POP4|nr:hypothetical protein [archaeon]MBT3450720.1 hypothetical protein [archaeon]MBT6869212.1 hypothetical protein [archaeon]MBT7193748.1 hypothetical protein [archaeon]MBT7381395.1 hypothetical protein [archaeon]